MNNTNGTLKIVLIALMTAMVCISTMFISVPVPATNGYIHLGDSMIFFGVLLLGWKWGAVASGVGSALADLLLGYAHYVPITLVVKYLMAVAMGVFIDYAIKKGAKDKMIKVAELFGMVIGGVVMILGYYLAASFMIGNFITPIAAIPMNIVQFGVGMVLATILALALSKTGAKSMFAYNRAI